MDPTEQKIKHLEEEVDYWKGLYEIQKYCYETICKQFIVLSFCFIIVAICSFISILISIFGK